MDNLELLASIPFISFITAGLGAYLGSYLRTKGQNLATHEDIDKLVDQVRAVTTATKEIESKISKKAWDRQRRWELKREVLFDAGRKISATADALSSMYAVYLTNKGATGQVSPERHDKALKAYRQITDSFYALEG